jgi:S-phase kinase-associated protein 1
LRPKSRRRRSGHSIPRIAIRLLLILTVTLTFTRLLLFTHPLIFLYITQTSKEGESFTVSVEVAKLSQLVKDTMDDDDTAGDEIKLPNVRASVLTKVIEYCEHYKTEEMTPITTPLKSSKLEDLVQPWYVDFCKVDQVMLFELVTAANFMDIKPLLDLTCLAVSIMIKVRTITM